MAERRMTVPDVDFVDHRRTVAGDIVAAWIVVVLLIGIVAVSFTLDQLVTVTAAPRETFAAAVAELEARQHETAAEDPAVVTIPAADEEPADSAGADDGREMTDPDR